MLFSLTNSSQKARFVYPALHASILASGVKRLFRYSFPVPVAKLNDAISSQVACLLKVEREKRGLSLNVLAQKAGLSRQTVSYVEQEVQNPTLDTLLRITSVLEIDLGKIICKARKAAVIQK
ncbi:MAG TPA: helix-turn-helix transcriptional regulator [Verrucomicrobiae bacterium]